MFLKTLFDTKKKKTHKDSVNKYIVKAADFIEVWEFEKKSLGNKFVKRITATVILQR